MPTVAAGSYASGMSIQSHLDGWPVCHETPVSWGQMDAFSHVNNIVYFRWFEDARFVLFERVGWSKVLEDTGIGPILARTQCVFKRAVTWPDRVTIGTRIEDLSEDRFTTVYRVVSHASGEIVAEGDGRVVSYDYGAGAKAPIPTEVHEALVAL